MRAKLIAATFLALAGLTATAYAQGGTRTAQILERFGDANHWRDHVMVVAHRGGGLMKGGSLYPENSVAAIEASIALGAEMVELDVQETRDGVFVVLHDTWLDRTTTCTGPLAARTLAELSSCRLKVGATGAVTGEGIPTLRRTMEVTRGRILFNIDNKLDIGRLPGMVAIARELGMANEVVVKQNLWNADRVAEALAVIGRMGGEVQFMPVIADDAVHDVGFLEQASRAVSARAVEMINWHAEGDRMTDTGGVLFSTRARAVAARGNWHIWVNTYKIVNKTGGLLAGGRGDELAVLADFPQETYGFWVDRGATMIQTDEPEAALRWLDANGYRIPYALTN